MYQNHIQKELSINLNNLQTENKTFAFAEESIQELSSQLYQSASQL